MQMIADNCQLGLIFGGDKLILFAIEQWLPNRHYCDGEASRDVQRLSWHDRGSLRAPPTGNSPWGHPPAELWRENRLQTKE